MHELKRIFTEAGSPEDFVTGYHARLHELLGRLDRVAVARCVEEVERAVEEDRTIFVVGNGGSGAVASHFVNDLGPNSLVDDEVPIRVLSLTDNVESLTAVANDSEYENVFLYQLRSLMRPGDMVIGLSVSGNSENVVRAVDYANELEGTTVGWTGMDGGRLAKRSTLSVHVPSTPDEYGPVEDVFAVLTHIVSSYITMKRGRNLHH